MIGCGGLILGELLNLSNPHRANSIARHTPFPSWRETYRSHLRSIGHTITFVLLTKEATEEKQHITLNHRGRIDTLKRYTCKIEYLTWLIFLEEEVVDKEVPPLNTFFGA